MRMTDKIGMVLAVCIKGENKKQVLIAENKEAHAELVAQIKDNIDNYVRFKVNPDGCLEVFVTSAAVDVVDREGQSEAVDNIFKACDYLVEYGYPGDAEVHIQAGMPFDRFLVETTLI